MAIKGSLSQFQQGQQQSENPYTQQFAGFSERAGTTEKYLKQQVKQRTQPLSDRENSLIQTYNNPINKTAFERSRKIFDAVLKGQAGKAEQERAKKLAPYIERDWTKINLRKTLEGTGQFAAELTGVPAAIRAADTLQKQARIGAEVQQAPSRAGAARAQIKFLEGDLKKGDISKEVYQREVKRMRDIISRDEKVIKEAEKRVGAKRDQSAGVLAAGELGLSLIPAGGTAATVARGVAARRVATRVADEVVEAAPTIKATISPELQTVKGIKKDIQETPASRLKLGSDTVSDELDVEQVAKYMADIKAGKPLDPVVVTKDKKGQLFVSDGAHRLEAAKQLGIDNIPVVEKVAPAGSPTKVSGNALRIQQAAVEKNLTNTIGDLPEYATINMKEQADNAVNLVNTDRKLAVDIIEGKANAPGNLRAQSVHQALEKVAIDEGNVELLSKLAKSRVNTELSTSAQNLRIAAERTPNSPVELIRQVRDARIKSAVRRARAKSEAELINKTKAQVRAAVKTPTKQDWATFINSLEC